MAVAVTPQRVREALDFALDENVMGDIRITESDCAAVALQEVGSRVTAEAYAASANEATLSRAADYFTAACMAPSIPGLLGIVYAANAPGSGAPTNWKAKMEVLRARGEAELQKVIGGADDATPGLQPYSSSAQTIVRW